MLKKLYLISLILFLNANLLYSFEPIKPKVVVSGNGVENSYTAHMLVLKPDGKLWSWGRNNDGQVGDGTNTDRSLPVLVGGQSRWKDVSAGYSHTVAIKEDGTLWGWGDNSFGQLGLGYDYYRVNYPVKIGNDNDWTEVYAGGFFTIARKSDGSLWAFGDGGAGQLGDNRKTSSRFPIRVLIPEGVTFTKISTGFDHVLAISNNGELYAWGGNFFAQIGDGNAGNINDVLSPKKIGDASDWALVSAGHFFSYGVKQNGELYVWGHNNGTLGMTSGGFVPVPTLNPNLPPLDLSSPRTMITAGMYNGVALNNGRLWIWGLNLMGQLGNGNAPNPIGYPINIDNEQNWLTVAIGGMNVIGIKTSSQNSYDYTLWTWGDNRTGQLGDGSTVSYKDLPTQIGFSDIYIEPASKDFGIIGLGNNSITETFTLYNTGFKTLNISDLIVEGHVNDFIITNNCVGIQIPQLNQCIIEVKFKPTITGNRIAYVGFNSDGALSTSTFLTLSGIGKASVNVSIRPNNDYGFVMGSGIYCPNSICTKEYTDQQITLTAYNSSPGTFFTHWSGDVNSTQNSITITLNSNKNIVANFGIQTFNINVNVGPNGRVSPDGNFVVNYGDSVLFHLIPNIGYKVSTVYGCPGILSGNYFRTSPITANCTLNVTFEEDINSTLIFTYPVPEEGGKINCVINQQGNNLFYNCTITPNTNYHIQEVYSDCGGTLNGNIFTTDIITGPCELSVFFGLNSYKLNVLKTGTGTGLVNSSPLGISCGNDCNEMYLYGSLITLTANPSSNSVFIGWSGDCIDIGNNKAQVLISSDKTCTAIFNLKQYQVTASADGNGTGAISTSSNEIVFYYPANNSGSANFNHGSIVTLIATAFAGSTVSWTSCNGMPFGNGTQSATCTFLGLDSSKTAKATFTLNQYTITSNINPTGSGTIICSPNPVYHGQTSTCTITPSAGYSVQSVTGTCGGNLNGNTFTTNPVTSNCSVIINLGMNTYNITTSVTPTSSGTITCVPNPVGGSISTCSVKANNGYYIKTIEGCGHTYTNTNENQLITSYDFNTGVINENCSIYATFSQMQCTPSPSGIISWWRGEGNGYDSVGFGHGVEMNSISYTEGRVGRSFNLDGIDDHIRVGDKPEWDFGTGDFSIEGWIKTTNPGAVMRLISAGSEQDGAYKLWAFGYGTHPFWGSGNRLNFAIYDGEGYPYTDISSEEITLNSNEWYHIAVVRNGEEMRFYVNGEPKGIENIGNIRIDGGNSGLIIGGRYYNSDIIEYASGQIDEVAIYNRALTVEEIGKIYNSGIMGKCYTEDTTPEPYNFTDITMAIPATVVESDTITVTGINAPTAITISGCTSNNCEYRINGGAWKSESGVVLNGDKVKVRQVSSSNYNTTTDLILNIGGVIDTFSVTTISRYTITTTVTPAGTGTIECTPNPVNHGTQSTCTITPSVGYTIQSVTGSCGGSLSGNTYTT
ncbi:MAG: hypothetical protein N2202_02270, partial [Proteobacteria bacterium]|nr:hypothetical protein [Pseudomonadota bacterium]